MKEKRILTCTNGEIVGVNRSTGEIIETDGWKLTISEQIDENIIRNYSSGKQFVKVYASMNELRKYLTTSEFIVAVTIMDYVCYEDFVLRKGGHGNGKVLYTKELAKEFDFKYDTMRKIMASLVKKGVVAVFKLGNKDTEKLQKAYIANPYIYSRGNNLSVESARKFNDSGWKWTF